MDILSQAPQLLRVGRTVGDYVLVGELGRGGFGVVFEAEHREDKTRVALKTLRADLSSPAGQRAFTRFLLEVRAVRHLRHPNVVRYIDGGQLNSDDGGVLAYFAMELLHGETLDQLIRKHGPMAPLEAGSVIRQAGVGLYTAHAQGIIHRDIKPGNIMLTPGGRAVVTDFGVCKILEVQNVTAAGQVVGTARYLSPEQLFGRPVDARSDVFALGAVLYFLLTGEHLRINKDLAVLSRAVAEGEDVLRARSAPGVPLAFRKVMARALAVNATSRFPNALSLAHALEEASLSREVVGWKRGPPGQQEEPAPTTAELETTESERLASDFSLTEAEGDGAPAGPWGGARTAVQWTSEAMRGVNPWELLGVASVAAAFTILVLLWLWP